MSSWLDRILPSRARAAGKEEAERSIAMREREHRLESAKTVLSHIRHLQAADESRRRPNWHLESYHADVETLHKLPILRSRSRLLADNDPKAGGLVHKEIINTIGPGFSVTGKIPKRARKRLNIDEDAAREIIEEAEEYWREEIADPESTGLDWRGFRPFLTYIHLMIRHVKSDGGLFLRFIPTPGRDLPFTCRIIEPECVGTPPNLQNHPRVRGGLEFAEDGRLVAFHVATRHPHDFNGTGQLKYERVERYNEFGLPQMIFHFSPNRESASRELPWMQRVLCLINDLADYKDSELQRKITEADIALIVKLNDPDGMKRMLEQDSGFGTEDTGNSNDGRSSLKWAKNQVLYAEPGEDTEVIDPSRPGNQFVPFLQSHDRDIGLGVGRSFELVSNNFGAANFSATRVSGVEDFVEHKTEFALIAPPVFGAMWKWSMFFLSLETGNHLFREVKPDFCRYQKPSWDPETDANAAEKRLATNSDLYTECAAVGRDAEAVISNRIRAEKFEATARAEAGLPSKEEQENSLDKAVDDKVKTALNAADKKKADDNNPAGKEEDNE